jgi:type I restriction enzyme S subunit
MAVVVVEHGIIVHLYYNHFKEIELCFPSPKEQQKIANTLSTLDNLIEAQDQKIAQLKQHKKALMQQMFVSNEVNCKTLVVSFSKSLSQ